MTQNHRRSALVLHAMSPSDRDWMLDQLDPQGRATLQGMLRELQSLGIPPDKDLLDAALETDHAQDRSTPSEFVNDANDAPGDLRAIRVVQLASPELLATLLKSESTALLGMLLSCHDWSWQTHFLGLMGAAKQREIEQFAALPGQVPPAARRALIRHIAHRVQAAGEPIDTYARQAAVTRGVTDAWRRLKSGVAHAFGRPSAAMPSGGTLHDR